VPERRAAKAWAAAEAADPRTIPVMEDPSERKNLPRETGASDIVKKCPGVQGCTVNWVWALISG
jgi:hypothetical protein